VDNWLATRLRYDYGHRRSSDATAFHRRRRNAISKYYFNRSLAGTSRNSPADAKPRNKKISTTPVVRSERVGGVFSAVLVSPDLFKRNMDTAITIRSGDRFDDLQQYDHEDLNYCRWVNSTVIIIVASVVVKIPNANIRWTLHPISRACRVHRA
jgi:hypothetical protein